MHEDDWLEAAYEDQFDCGYWPDDEDFRDYEEEEYNEWLMNGGDL